MIPGEGESLAKTSLYNGPKPAHVWMQSSPHTKEWQLREATSKLREQVRAYGDFLRDGDRLGVIVARRNDRNLALNHFEDDEQLKGKAKIIKSRDADEDYDPSFVPDCPICIVTVKGCKGLEFRAVHWLFADELDRYHDSENFYTVVTRAKTSLDIYYTQFLPNTLARAYSKIGGSIW
jgi:superfamily I DNA and RNA helicase